LNAPGPVLRFLLTPLFATASRLGTVKAVLGLRPPMPSVLASLGGHLNARGISAGEPKILRAGSGEPVWIVEMSLPSRPPINVLVYSTDAQAERAFERLRISPRAHLIRRNGYLIMLLAQWDTSSVDFKLAVDAFAGFNP
jgi:hypothetical protein